jgi:hypothetical protein
LRKLPLLAALLCSLASAQAAGPLSNTPNTSTTPVAPAVPAQHPIVGSWTWTLPGKACAETYKYRANGTRTGSSGEEFTLSNYEITPIPSLLGFYRLVETVTNGNGKPDCSGDRHEASDQRVTRFIQFSPKLDQFIVCKAESLQACFGPLKRAPG